MAYEWLDKIRQYLPASKQDGAFDDLPSTSASAQRPSGTTSAVSQWEAWARLMRSGIPILMITVGVVLSLFTELVGIWAILGYFLVATAPVVYLLLRIEQRLIELRESIQRLPTATSSKSVSRSGSNFNKYD